MAYPNPSSGSATILFEGRAARTARVEIFGVDGRRLRILQEADPLWAGSRRVIWDGRDASGKPLPSGVYYYSVRIGDSERSGRLVLVR